MSDSEDGTTGYAHLTRRSWLAVVGSSAALATGAAQVTSASEHGYGASGYGTGSYGGEQSTTTEPAIAVETVGPTEIGATTATAVGNLTQLDGLAEATVLFEYGPSNESLSETTATQTVTETGEFTVEVSGLASDTEYDLRAVAIADSLRETGGVASFTTEQQTTNPTPTIDRLAGADVSNHNNPHLGAELTWAATIDDGEIYAATLTLSGPDGQIRTWEYDLTGQSVERTETDRVPLGAKTSGTEYTADLIVYSYNGNYTTETTTFESQ